MSTANSSFTPFFKRCRNNFYLILSSIQHQYTPDMMFLQTLGSQDQHEILPQLGIKEYGWRPTHDEGNNVTGK
jgi:hypothetical protein